MTTNSDIWPKTGIHNQHARTSLENFGSSRGHIMIHVSKTARHLLKVFSKAPLRPEIFLSDL